MRTLAINTTDGPRRTAARRAVPTDPPPGVRDRARYRDRAGWEADETLRFGPDGTELFPTAFFDVQTFTVHHTVTANADPTPAATVRAIYVAHTVAQNFGDIGYHLLVDQQGGVYEGRWSGADPVPVFGPRGGRPLMCNAAHVGGFNAANVGIALLGDLTSTQRIRIVDAGGRPVPTGMDGEVVVRGPQLMTGYAGRPDATRAALRRGWLRTGDVGHLDPEGYLHLTDRLTDVIVSGGENVYSAVVEQALCTHPAVADAAVVGVPDARWGETVHATVVLRPRAAVTADELVAFCRERLGGVARPRSVEFRSALPRTSMGKVHKRALREPFWAGHERQVAEV